MQVHRNAAKFWICAVLSAMLLGAPFRYCAALEHGPPGETPSVPPAASHSDHLPLTTLSALLPSRPVQADLIPAASRHALVYSTVMRTVLGERHRYAFVEVPVTLEQRQRQQVALLLSRAVAPRVSASAMPERIAEIYSALQLAHWGRHADGLLGGHFNYDYRAVACVDLDRTLPHSRYGVFASLHFHHDQQRVHVDVANPFGMAGLMVPLHFFLDVVGGHLTTVR